MSKLADLPALVERARSLDDDAWEQLYRLLYPRLLSYARQRLDDDRAKEAVSETMARAVAGIDRFVWRGGGFESWVFAIHHNVITDAHRRARRPPPAFADGPSPDPVDGMIDDEDADGVRAAFSMLTAADQQLLHLRVVCELSSEEVGRVLGKRPGAVRMAQGRALQRLRELLEERER